MLLPALLLLATGGCTTDAGSRVESLPALRTDTTAAGTAELVAAGARLVGGTTLLLAADAFRSDPELVVERRRRSGLDGYEDGLDLSAPVRLRLEWQGGACRLVRIGADDFVKLDAVRCRPVED